MLRRSLLRRICPDGQHDMLLPEPAVPPVSELPSRYWRNASNFRGLSEFLLHHVATIILDYSENYLDVNLYLYYYSSHYVCRYLSHHPWWQNVYAASAARVLSRQRQGPPPHDCQCQSLFHRGDRSAAVGTATQGGPGAPRDHPGRDHVEARALFWCRVDRVSHRPTLGNRQGPGHDP